MGENENRIGSKSGLMILFILVFTAIVMSPGIHGAFLNWDDLTYVINNPLVHKLSLSSLKEIFLTPEVLGNYHPVTMVFYAIEYAFFGANPMGYHIIGIMIHLLNTFLIFQLIRQINNQVWIAFFTALLFGIHPAHVESVVWISEAKGLLYVLFFVLGLYSYERSKKSDSNNWYLAVWLFFILSLLSKGMAVVFPLILVALDYRRSNTVVLKDVINKIPFFIISLGFGVVVYLVQVSSGATSQGVDVINTEQFFYAMYSFSKYLGFVIIPYPLAPVHPYPTVIGESIPLFVYVFGIASVLLFGGLFWYVRKSKELLFGLVFSLFCILPLLQFLSVGMALISERYAYLAYVGLFYFLAVLGWNYYESLAEGMKKAILTGVLVVLGIYSYQSYVHASTWENDYNLWTKLITAYPNDFFGYEKRGLLHSQEGESDLAIKDFSTYIVIYDKNPNVFVARGLELMKQQKLELALEDFLHAIELNPQNYVAHINIGVIGMNLRLLDLSKKHLDIAVQLKPKGILGYINRGIFLTGVSDYKEALNDFNIVLSLDKGNQDALFLRAQSYYFIGNIQSAITDFEILNSQHPQNPDYKIWLQKLRD
jgi:tetratricopeptide (TPR) repeat protein